MSLKSSLLEQFVTVVVLSLVEYSAVRAYLLSLRKGEYSLLELLGEALSRTPEVIVVNVLAYLTALLLMLMPFAILIIGATTLNPPLAFLRLFMFLAIIPLILTFFAIVIPVYVETHNIGAFVEALGLIFKNLPGSFGYGLLVILLGFAIAIVMAPILLPLTMANANSLAIVLVEAPFKAFFMCFLWASGLLLYRDFKGINEKEESLY